VNCLKLWLRNEEKKMSLVLGVRIGEAVYVNDTPIRLDVIFSTQHVLVKNMDTGESHDVSMAQACEVLPDVFIALGDKSTTVVTRLAIDAPRNMKILHGTRYRQLKGDKEAVRPPPSTRLDLMEFKVPADIIERAKELGIGNAQVAVKQMVRLSAPISMPGYNRRFQHYIFLIDADTVVALDELSAEQQSYYDSRNYEDRLLQEDTVLAGGRE
jgi:hypothetical protein